MQKNDLKKDSQQKSSEDKKIESFIKNCENQNSALKKILEKFKKNN